MLCNKGTWMQILVQLPSVDSYVYENRDHKYTRYVLPIFREPFSMLTQQQQK